MTEKIALELLARAIVKEAYWWITREGEGRITIEGLNILVPDWRVMDNYQRAQALMDCIDIEEVK